MEKQEIRIMETVDSKEQVKKIAIKGLCLDRCLRAYHNSDFQREEALLKCINVWGEITATNFLSKYNDGMSLIRNLDSKNLDLFLEKF